MLQKIKDNYYYGIFLIPIIINPWGLNIYSVPKTSWFLLFMGLLSGVTAWRLLNGESLKIKYQKHLAIFILALTASLVLSTIFSVAPIQSIFGEYLNPQGLITYLLIFIHFFVCIQLFSKKENIQKFFTIIKFLALFLCLHAIGQRFNIDPFTAVDNQEYLFRVYSTIGQPNFLGQFLIFPLFIILFQLKETFSFKKIKKHLPSLILLLLILLTLYLTKNKATWLALAVSIYIWFIFFTKIPRLYKIIPSALLFLGLISSLFFIDFSFRSLQVRSFLWIGSFQIMDAQNIIQGTGLGSFYQEFVKIMPVDIFYYEEFYKTPANAHNELLHTLVERGFLGLVLYLIPIIYLITLIIQKRIKGLNSQITFIALIAYLISVQFSFSTIEHYLFIAAFWAILLQQTLDFKSITIKFKNYPIRILSSILLNILMITLIFGSYSFIKTELYLKKGIEKYIQTFEGVHQYFDKAASSSKFFVYPQKITIDFFASYIGPESPLIPELEKNLQRIKTITNQNFLYNIAAMQLASTKSNPISMSQNFKEAQSKAPNLPILYTEAGNIEYHHNNCPAAIQHYQKLINLAPDYIHMQNSPNFEEREKFRLFQKHATSFFSAMNKFEDCMKSQ